MAEMIRNDRRINQVGIATFLVGATLIAGIVGGLIGARVASGSAAVGVQAAQTVSVDWARYGAEWQSQYEQQHPTTLNATMAQYGTAWQRQYEQQHPTMLNPTMVQYGIDWQRQYEQQHPPS